METYQAILLGAIQGLTEFLPVSSSGHLALGQHAFGIKEPTLFFDVSLHIGTLIAVVVIFFDDIKEIVKALLYLIKTLIRLNLDELKGQIHNNPEIRLVFLILVATIPTGFIGLFLKQYVDIMFGSINFVGSMLLITGTFLWLTKDIKKGRENKVNESNDEYNMDMLNKRNSAIMDFGYKQALFIGVCQGIAVAPGISRSGATIAAGLFASIDRETAAKFSFLISIPSIVGAELLSLKDVLNSEGAVFVINLGTFYGTFVAFIVGYAALKVLIKIVKVGKLHLFAPYCWILGIIAVIAGVL